MNLEAEVNELEALGALFNQKVAKIKAYCQQAKKKKTDGVSTPSKRRKKGPLTNIELAEVVAKSRARRKIT